MLGVCCAHSLRPYCTLSLFAEFTSSFAANTVIDHDDLIDIDVHAVAMYTMVDGGFVHDAEPLTRVCGEASWMCQYLGISEALISMIVLGS